MSEFGQRVRERRKEKGVSQDELAMHLKVKSGKQTISKWEQGKTVPDLIQIRAIAEALNTSAAWLVDGIRQGDGIPEGYILIEKDKLLRMQEELITYQRKELGHQRA